MSLLGARPVLTKPEVALVFPPLVETNFGGYYPSTAVLAAYLTEHGIPVLQEDLNEEFALYLLAPATLRAATIGALGSAMSSEFAEEVAVAARLLARNRYRMFDAQGRHLFHETQSPLAHLLLAIARAFKIDLTFDRLLDPRFRSSGEAGFYTTFYDENGWVQRIPDTVHTVGISVPMGPQLAPGLLLAMRVRQRRPDACIVLGGPTFSLMGQDQIGCVLDSWWEVDAIVRFDGEEPLAAIATRHREGRFSFRGIPGVSTRRGSEVAYTPAGHGPRMDDLPFAEYDPALLSRLAGQQVGIQQARGCYWGECAYCDFIELYGQSPPFRTRTPERFVDEMQHQMRAHGVWRFVLITEAIPPAFARKVSELIILRGLRVQWSSFCMVDRRFSRELLEAMARSGCTHLVVGVETMTDRVLALVRKHGRREENIRFVRDAHAAGVKICINLIPDLPTTTYCEAMESLDDFRQLRDCLSYVSVFPFEATASSAIGRAPTEFGLDVRESNTDRGMSEYAGNHLAVIDPAMTEGERSEVIASYQEFAREVNAANRIQTSDGPFSAGGPGAQYRLAEEYFDVTPGPHGFSFYHWATRERFHKSKGWARVLDLARSLQPFGREAFVARFTPPAAGEKVFQELIDRKMIVAAAPGPCPGDDRLEAAPVAR